MHDLRYPIGQHQAQPYSEAQLQQWLTDIRYLPGHLENAILNLDASQLETPYRPGGWTVKQVVHHVADSHMNAYIRCKLGLTERVPVIKPYDEAAWAELPDTKNLPINISLTLLHALHTRWLEIFTNLQPADWNKAVYHPGSQQEITLWEMLGSYSWHGRHHTAHVTALRERMKW